MNISCTVDPNFLHYMRFLTLDTISILVTVSAVLTASTVFNVYL